jgi:hypothetical protein
MFRTFAPAEVLSEKIFAPAPPWTVTAALAVVVPIPIFPPAVIVNTFAPVEDASEKIGEVVAIACRLKVPYFVDVPTCTDPLLATLNATNPVELDTLSRSVADVEDEFAMYSIALFELVF